MAIDISNTPASLEEPVDTRIVLKVNGKSYKAWKSVNVERSIVQIAGSFSFTTANRFSGNNAEWGITTGDECTIEVVGERVLTGYIDTIEDGYGIGFHDITFSGRDKTADLVDCDYTINVSGNQFLNLTFLQILTKLCSPFGIAVSLDSTIAFEASILQVRTHPYIVSPGAKIYELISDLCQQYGVLPITTGNGDLLITRSGTLQAVDSLEVGVNIKSNKLVQSDKDRYSIYYANGTPKTTAFNTETTSLGVLSDNQIKRFRPLVILSGDQPYGDDELQKRAAWEDRIRAGVSRKVETVVRKWDQVNGGIWPLNGLIQMKDNKIGVQGKRLIAGINLNLDAGGGELTTLAIVPPDTFILKERVPVPDKKLTAFD